MAILQEAQQAYDLALKQYESSMSTQGLYADDRGNVRTSAGLKPNNFGGFTDWGSGALGLANLAKSWKPIQMGGAANRSGLDAALKALQDAQGAQQGMLNNQYGKLTGQASDALYGGILGYNPKPLTADNGQQFAAPQGNLQDPYGKMQGLLGQARPQFSQMGGMGEMMQAKMRMY